MITDDILEDAKRAINYAKVSQKPDRAKLIVDAIEVDICDRKGLKSVWADIDIELRKEIKETWRKIIELLESQ